MVFFLIGYNYLYKLNNFFKAVYNKQFQEILFNVYKFVK